MFERYSGHWRLERWFAGLGGKGIGSAPEACADAPVDGGQHETQNITRGPHMLIQNLSKTDRAARENSSNYVGLFIKFGKNGGGGIPLCVWKVGDARTYPS